MLFKFILLAAIFCPFVGACVGIFIAWFEGELDD